MNFATFTIYFVLYFFAFMFLQNIVNNVSRKSFSRPAHRANRRPTQFKSPNKKPTISKPNPTTTKNNDIKPEEKHDTKNKIETKENHIPKIENKEHSPDLNKNVQNPSINNNSQLQQIPPNNNNPQTPHNPQQNVNPSINSNAVPLTNSPLHNNPPNFNDNFHNNPQNQYPINTNSAPLPNESNLSNSTPSSNIGSSLLGGIGGSIVGNFISDKLFKKEESKYFINF